MAVVEIVPPFLKWAGGKRWLVNHRPNLFNTNFKRYIEPFLGSGAVFFHLQPANAILCDQNPSLIETYNAIKGDWARVLRELRKHQRSHSRAHYYAVRETKYRSRYTRAAQFIYLNRTCWNGLYRVNLSGEFNVPIGTKSNVLLDTDDFQRVSDLLSNSDLKVRDFEKTIDLAKSGDLIFADPPYTVKHNLNGFIKYNERLFGWDDQIRLHHALCHAQKRGARIILTNADHSSIRKLYKKHFCLESVSRKSVLSGDKNYRGEVRELIITTDS